LNEYFLKIFYDASIGDIGVNMVYKKHPPKSRKYRKSSSHSHQQHIDEEEKKSIQPVEAAESVKAAEPEHQPERKSSSNPFSFLTSLLGSGEKDERTGSPLLKVFNHDIFFDDLLLVGLIFLLMTEKDKDEILLIVLAYLLLDMF
jgi:hypothetical protein